LLLRARTRESVVTAVALCACGLTAATAHATTTIKSAGGVSYVSTTVTANANSLVEASAKCPNKKHVLGGGESNNGVYDSIAVQTSYPEDLGDADKRPDDEWTVFSFNDSNAQVSYTVWATCANLKPAYLQRSITFHGPGQTPDEFLHCPPRMPRVISGGNSANTIPPTINTSKPFDDPDNNGKPDDGWKIRVDVPESGYKTIREYAICAKAHTKYVHKGFGLPDDNEYGDMAFCPSGTFAWGGGEAAVGGLGDMAVNSLYPFGSGAAPRAGFTAYIDNFSGFPRGGAVDAICGPSLK
jgi:hypothetical protein